MMTKNSTVKTILAITVYPLSLRPGIFTALRTAFCIIPSLPVSTGNRINVDMPAKNLLLSLLMIAFTIRHTGKKTSMA